MNLTPSLPPFPPPPNFLFCPICTFWRGDMEICPFISEVNQKYQYMCMYSSTVPIVSFSEFIMGKKL